RIAGVDHLGDEEKKLIEIAMWASEPVPFDPMEKALHAAYLRSSPRDERANFRMIHEYPLGGKPPVMTHIFEGEDGRRIIAVQDGREALAARAGFPPEARTQWDDALRHLTQKGFRVLGVAEGTFEGDDFPKDQATLPVTVLRL